MFHAKCAQLWWVESHSYALHWNHAAQLLLGLSSAVFWLSVHASQDASSVHDCPWQPHEWAEGAGVLIHEATTGVESSAAVV